MYCPEQLIFQLGRLNPRWGLTLWFQASQDTRWKYIPWRKWLNPLRYYLHISTPWRSFTINPDGRWHVAVANFLWQSGLRCRVGMHYWHDDHCLKCDAPKNRQP